jgi:hypothetical protein
MIARLLPLCVALHAAAASFAFGAVPSTPPLPPLPVSPVATFRELLAMAPAEREAALAARNEKQRAALQGRLSEYDALPEAQREARLRATDLYWHLNQLLRRAPGERVELLKSAPATLRPVLIQRLGLWDQLPAADREALLQHERTIRYFARLRETPMPPLPGSSVAPAPSVPLRIQAELARLQELSPAERQRLQGQWKQLFESPAPQAPRALQGMSREERTEMIEALRQFRELSPTQRQLCIDAFARLASMPPREQAEFLQSAERWEALPQEERAAWRRLITKLPPLPPVQPRGRVALGTAP